MEKVAIETPHKEKNLVESENALPEFKTPQNQQISNQKSDDSCKTGTPARLTLSAVNSPSLITSKMEKVAIEAPHKDDGAQSENTLLELKTPPTQNQQILDQKSHNSSNDLRKTGSPVRLSVPKAFKYPESYTSPTDLMMSPISKGLLARRRKGSLLLPPSKNQPKILESRLQDVGLF
ncbi:uncharacterized protein LOC131166590 isoform X2 [Malania oleifera]|uniref:uncharacterized protein LOC131166590 isoform X2 n=1 Tax=Malania oleifera TaxID=397392 RepID=UPI0025AEC402|nr:uncharacterized protein LOC131166590 isoform X2 [Malania oleifera]